ncbi:MAG: SpoIIE family protein phosphatase [Oscillospiraceae bacterium]|nr:SpoIIE family protein phosphatase [Oscillospiraceae bacterium]
METYLRRGQRRLRQWAMDPNVQAGGRLMAYGGSGFLLSAASLGNLPQPLAMGLVCAVTGWRAVVMTLGSILGYQIFWGNAGIQGMIWSAAGGMLSLFLGKRTDAGEQPLLIPLLAAFLVAAIGLSFQVVWEDDTPLLGYFLRIAVAAGAALLFRQAVRRRDAVPQWIAGAAVMLALAQVAPLPFLSLGYIGAGVMALGSSFPAAALAGLGLDMAQVTRVPMTATMCIAYFLRQIPFENKYLRYAAPCAACAAVMVLTGLRDLNPLPGLLLGGYLASLLPPRMEAVHHRGETGIAQVRLELAAGVLGEMRRQLQEAAPPPIDERALLQKARERACSTCSARNTCGEQEKFSAKMLHYPLDFHCRKTGRVIAELRRSQEQLRYLKADRDRRREYRAALVQQYQFLSAYLQNLADQLPRRGERLKASFSLEIGARSAGKERVNGDVCMAFPGTGCRYFVLLCDGMGTGQEARREAKPAAQLVRELLTAGFPAEYAFRSVNSLLALRGQAGAVTLDLAEVRLDTGKAVIYKWGAAPSWVLRRKGAEKIGTAAPPPGISVTGTRETVVRLSLRQGEVLILLSDGTDAEQALRQMELTPDAPPGELAAQLLEKAGAKGEDDATAAVLRLRPADPAS